MAGERQAASFCQADNPVLVDDGTLCLAATPAPGSVGKPEWTDLPGVPLDLSATRAAQEASISLGAEITWDSVVRATYNAGAQAIRDQARQLVESGRMTPDEAKVWANGQRNALIVAARDRSSPLGRALAELIKPSSKLKTVEDLEKLGKSAEGIIASAGRTNPWVNRLAVGFRYGGPGLLLIGMAFSAYHVAAAPQTDRWHVVAEEGGLWIGSLGGGWAFGEGGCAAGAAVGAAFAGVGAVPGCFAGAVVGTIGGAIFGGWAGSHTADYVYRAIERGSR